MIDENGKLFAKYMPAIYLDSSVLIDYWMAEGIEGCIEENHKEQEKMEPLSSAVLTEFRKSEVRLIKVGEIRGRFIYEQAKVTPIVTPLSLLELVEWYAERGMRQYVSDLIGIMHPRRKGKKDFGLYLKKVLEYGKSEMESKKRKILPRESPIEILMMETMLNRSFTECHGLQGLLHVNIKNFNFTIGNTWQEPSAYAFLQLGMADIMHILVARHLGCSYFASWDEDFKRVKDIMHEEANLTLLSSPEEILNVL